MSVMTTKKKLKFFVEYFQDAMSYFEDKRLKRELKLLLNLAECSTPSTVPQFQASTAIPSYPRGNALSGPFVGPRGFQYPPSGYPLTQPYVPSQGSTTALPAPTQTTSPPATPQLTETEIPKVKEQETAADGAPDLCLICMAKQIKTVNIPCGHRVYCLTCVHLQKAQSKKVVCPTCRKELAQVMETF